MNYWLYLILIFGMMSTTPLLGGSMEIVDSNFGSVDAQGKGVGGDIPGSLQQLPMRQPSTVALRHGARFLKGEKSDGVLDAPCAIFQTEGAALAEGVFPSTWLHWQISDLGLDSGKYEFVFSASNPKGVELAFRVNLIRDPRDAQFGVTFKEGQWAATQRGTPISMDTPHATVKLSLDLDSRVWGATINGQVLFENSALGGNPASDVQLSSLEFIIKGAGKGENSSVALSPLRMVRQEEPPLRKRKVVACVGDSITAGYGIKTGRTYPHLLAKFLGNEYWVRNAGVSGTTLLKKGDSSYWKTQNFKRASNIPDIVVLMLGTNDGKPQNWALKDSFPEDLLAMIEHFKSLPTHPRIVIGLPPPIYAPAYGITEEVLKEIRPLIKRGADEAGIEIIDFATLLSGHPEWFPDGIHPNEQGAEEMARRVSEVILSSSR